MQYVLILWIAIIAYLIIAKIKADYKSPYSITEVATLIRISALERVDLRGLITKPKDSIIQKQDVKENTLIHILILVLSDSSVLSSTRICSSAF